jgi:hypothetical protein
VNEDKKDTQKSDCCCRESDPGTSDMYTCFGVEHCSSRQPCIRGSAEVIAAVRPDDGVHQSGHVAHKFIDHV